MPVNAACLGQNKGMAFSIVPACFSAERRDNKLEDYRDTDKVACRELRRSEGIWEGRNGDVNSGTRCVPRGFAGDAEVGRGCADKPTPGSPRERRRRGCGHRERVPDSGES